MPPAGSEAHEDLARRGAERAARLAQQLREDVKGLESAELRSAAAAVKACAAAAQELSRRLAAEQEQEA